MEHETSFGEEDGSYTKDDWQENWELRYPQENRWYLLGVVKDCEWLVVLLDNSVILQANVTKPERWDNPERANAFAVLADLVREHVAGMKSGTYEELVANELPYNFRWGFLHRDEFWRIAGKDALQFGGEMSREEAGELAQLLEAQPPEEYMTSKINLTMEQYFDALKQAYEAIGLTPARKTYREFELDDPRAWYSYFGDDRDDSIYNIDQTSADALREYFKSDHSFNHTFEILMGRGCTRVFLAPRLYDDGTWRLIMYGHFTYHADDMARMWRKLNEIGMPTYLRDAHELSEILQGKDWILIAPKHEYVDYMSGRTAFGRKVGLGIHLWEEYQDELIAAAEWMPLEMPKLKCDTQNPASK